MGSEPRSDPKSELINLPFLHKFKLYATTRDYYLIGKDEKKSFWRVLKIDRRVPNELNLYEDPTKYSNEEIRELKGWLRQGNKKDGGFEAVTTCYGIIGFVRFLEPYYMLVITKRKKVGEICGHTVYGIEESKMIVIPHPSVQTKVARSSDEKSYTRLLSMVNLSKNFYFSYTYHLMYSLQKNVCNTERGKSHDDKMFVWNSYLTRGIRTILQNTIWTVSLVYGFFEQTFCSVSGEDFVLTVIARRSRHYAGTRYLRRGVNEVGRVANDVETEQIVSKKVPEGQKIPIASVVQVRGSIPLYWSQETSFNPQPEIILSKKDANYEATHRHFENLRLRYGPGIIILNLLKDRTHKKAHRETILWEEFAKSIWFTNRVVKEEDRLKATHFDLSKHYKSGVNDAFHQLCIFARQTMELTDLFFSKCPSGVGAEAVFSESFFNNPIPSQEEETNCPDTILQNGVLRTNCVDCLDRTNFAQYAYGLVALAHQLHTLGITGPPVVDINNPLAIKLMETYENMGDTIALQYGGSKAHRKMFCDLRGGFNKVRKHRDVLTTLHRYYSNTCMDKEKQNAINVFLGHFRPRLGRPAIWELDSDQHNTTITSSHLDIEIRPLVRRSLSSNILMDGDLNLEKLVLPNPQPSREGLNGGILEIESDFPEPAFLSTLSSNCCEDHSRAGSSHMFPGSCSSSDSLKLSDIPGYAHSYDAKFKLAEEIYGRSSSPRSWSSDNILTEMESLWSYNNTNSSFEHDSRRGFSDQSSTVSEHELESGFWHYFTRCALCGKAL